MEKYIPTYKCQICNTLIFDINEEFVKEDDIQKFAGRKTIKKPKALHFCKNGDKGIVKFVGFVKKLEIKE